MAQWREIFGNWVLIPNTPHAIIHFLGGAFVAAAPHVSYRSLLETLADDGYVIIATPFSNTTLDHRATAQQVLDAFNNTLTEVRSRYLRRQYLPIYGVGHSMGCKLHLLIGSEFPQERAGNILIAYNNYPLKNAVPMLDQVSQFTNQLSSQLSNQLSQFTDPLAKQVSQVLPTLTKQMEAEFTPSPEQTNELIRDRYQVKRNLLLKFTTDTIDQTRPLHDILRVRFPDYTTVQILKGNHLTPLSPDVKWQAGKEFSPLDAVGQLMRQNLNRDFYRFQSALLYWLDPTRPA